jgi:hypothetical protein
MPKMDHNVDLFRKLPITYYKGNGYIYLVTMTLWEREGMYIYGYQFFIYLISETHTTNIFFTKMGFEPTFV